MNGDPNDEDNGIVIVDDGFPWSDSQRRIIAHRDGPLQIAACAGSGKTLTISRKIAEMVHNGIDRNSIVAFTFTDNAAEELKVRIRRQMEIINPENPVLSRMHIGTIHSFCIKLLHEFDSDTLSYDVLDDNKLIAFLSQHYFDIGLHLFQPRHPANKFKKIGWFAEDIDTMRREQIEDSIRQLDNINATEFLAAYDRYLVLLENYHFIDYEGIIYRTVRLLESNPDIMAAVRDKYRYIVVDEYQDIDTLQERLIELLSGDTRNLCVVGDDDQSIYKWRGARIDNFINFARRYDSPLENLDQNHRSTSLIVDIADNIIRNNDNRIIKDMLCNERFDLGDVYQLYFQTEDQEVAFICNKIEELLGTIYRDKGQDRCLSHNDFAVLLRRKKDMEQIIAELDRRGIPCAVRGDESIFGRPESAFIRLAFAFIAGGADPNLTIIDIENTTYNREVRYIITEEILRTAIRSSRLLNNREEQIIAGLNAKRQWFTNPTSRRIQPQKDFQEILSLMGIRDLNGAFEAFTEPIMYDLGKISSLLKDFETVYELIFPDQINRLVEFLDWAFLHAKSKIDDPTLIDAVNIMTIHAAKGMEYPVVFLPALTLKGFSNRPPISRSAKRPNQYEWIPEAVFSYRTYEENEEDYRRLFYVAITRSKKYLFLTGSRNRIGYRNRQNPSVYYREVIAIENYNIINEPSADPTPRARGRVVSRREYVYPTSFTDLRYFQKCPFDYKLRKIYGFAPPIDSAFGYGFAVHDILREIHQRFEGETTTILPSPGEIRSLVDDRNRFFLRYARDIVETNLRNTAKNILVNYISGFGQGVVLTYKAEEPFEYLIEDNENDGAALVSGTIDLLQKIDPNTREVREVEVIDFKTEHEPDSEFDPKIRDARYQIRLYALATRSEFDITSVGGFIHYLNEGHRVSVDLGNRELMQVETSVKQNVNRIMRRMFFPTPHIDKCNTCDFKRICGHAVAR
ncbi:MAG: ATP-dependent DNA helicase [Methanothrix sp.]|nr:ATP-dependent DNA helicase [Methanothrix sp.]MDD4446688.1 ATP-dependent DNA helicase [Methanothrix sp.]